METPAEFGDMWEDIYPTLMRRARRLTRGRNTEPEDLVSQATIKVLNYSQSDNEISNFAGLMQLSLMQVHIDLNRNLGAQIFDQAAEFQEAQWCCETAGCRTNVERSLIARETLDAILDWIETLPQLEQILFDLRFLQEKSFIEISEIVGLSAENARQRIRKLRIKLRHVIDNYG